jgi:hypothetical protein
MSGTFSAPAGTPEACPLCGTPLRGDQDWCLGCGAAARTRLAAPANWRAPIVLLGVTVVLSLGVLSVSLVKLAEKPSHSAASTTTVLAAPPPAAAPAPPVTALSTATATTTTVTTATQSTLTATRQGTINKIVPPSTKR